MNAHIVLYYRFLTFLAKEYNRPMAQYGYHKLLERELDYATDSDS